MTGFLPRADQVPTVPSVTAISGATCAIGRPEKITSSTAAARNSALSLRRLVIKQDALTSVSIRPTGTVLRYYTPVRLSTNGICKGLRIQILDNHIPPGTRVNIDAIS
jgi:hypothetical protein